MPHAFLIDLTKRYEDASQVITDIREYSASYSPTVMEWVARNDQRQLLATDVVHEAEPGLDLPTRIKTIVQHMSQNGARGSTIHVLSYEGYVLAAVSGLNGPECCVVGHPIRSIEKSAGRNPIRVPAPFLDSRASYRHYPGATLASGRSEGISIEEAVALAKNVLRDGGHTSSERPLHQNALRPQMVLRDRRATKNQFDLTSRMLITTVVGIGLRDGWLRREIYEGRSGHEYIWIQEDNRHSAPTHVISPPVAPAHALALRPDSEADKPAAESGPVPSATDTKPEPSPVSESRPYAAKPNYRDTAPGQMESILREEEIGSPASARPFLFAAVREALAENPPDGARLWDEVSQIASKAAQGKTHVKEWDRTTECFLNMLFAASLLLDEGEQPIPRDYARWSAKVTSHVKEDFELRAEAYLAYRIIVRRGGIQAKEVPTLGLAVYQQGKGVGPSPREIKVNAANLIAYLEQIGLVSIQDGKINPTAC